MVAGLTIECASFYAISFTRTLLLHYATFGLHSFVVLVPRLVVDIIAVTIMATLNISLNIMVLFLLFQTVFDPIFISFYNLFYTSLPVLSLGIFDQDVNDRNSLIYPKLYTPGHMDLLFNKREFLRSALHGFFTSCVLFLVPLGE
jgi:magnesium-transporting ATPase (P-type)